MRATVPAVIGGICIAAILAPSGAAGAGLYSVGSAKQLFIDNQFFETSSGMSLALHPPRKTGEVTIRSEGAWEDATLNWLNVMQEGGKFRMWYEAYDVAGWPTADDTSFCYAESDDGIHWTKPNLGLTSYQGSTNNNLLFRTIGPPGANSRLHGAGIFVDPTAPSASRYKAVSQGIFSAYSPPHKIAGMESPDGYHWTRYADPVVSDTFADSQDSAFWDPTRQKYVVYGRVGSSTGRAIGRSESADFQHFSPLSLIMQTDASDPANSDLYNAPAMKYAYAANAYFMFPSLYQHTPDTLDIRLAVSRDGVTWTRPFRNQAYIPLGSAGQFDSGSLYMGQGAIQVGNELWQYYSGSPLTHEQNTLENLMIPGNQRVYSRVVSRIDGLISADAGEGGGYFITPPLTFDGGTLRLNVQAKTGGSVRVGLLNADGSPIPGRFLTDSIPITGDLTDVMVAWQNGIDVSSRSGVPTRLYVQMTNASLYAYQFTEAITGSLWRQPLGGDWSAAVNWTGAVPNGTGALANFVGGISSPQTVITNGPLTLGKIHFDSAVGYQISGQGSLTMDVSSGAAGIEVRQGRHTINLPLVLKDNTTADVADGATLVIADPLTLTAGSALTKTGSGALLIEAPVRSIGGLGAALSVRGGTTTLAFGDNADSLSVSVGAGLARFGSDTVLRALDAATDNPGDQQIDLAGSAVRVVAADLSAAEQSIYADIRTALYSNTGCDGIYDSSAAFANEVMGVTDVTAGGSVLLRLTLAGDANVDGAVDLAELAILASNWQSTGLWDNGDFNYDGTIDITDLGLLASSWQSGLSPHKPNLNEALHSLGLPAPSVPEPAAVSLGALTVLGLRRRSRRNRGNRQFFS